MVTSALARQEVDEPTSDTRAIWILLFLRFALGGSGCSTSNDISRQTESLGHEIATRFRYDPQTCLPPIREIGTDCVGDRKRGGVKGGIFETSADIEYGKLVARFSPHVEHGSAAPYGVRECRGVETPTPNVETNSNHIKAKLLCFTEQARHCDQRCAELEVEATQSFRVVRVDADDELGRGEGSSNFIKFVRVVKGHHLDIGFCRVTDE